MHNDTKKIKIQHYIYVNLHKIEINKDLFELYYILFVEIV